LQRHNASQEKRFYLTITKHLHKFAMLRNMISQNARMNILPLSYETRTTCQLTRAWPNLPTTRTHEACAFSKVLTCGGPTKMWVLHASQLQLLQEDIAGGTKAEHLPNKPTGDNLTVSEI